MLTFYVGARINSDSPKYESAGFLSGVSYQFPTHLFQQLSAYL